MALHQLIGKNEALSHQTIVQYSVELQQRIVNAHKKYSSMGWSSTYGMMMHCTKIKLNGDSFQLI